MEVNRAPLAGRYRIVGAFKASGSARQWRGVDERSARPVAVGEVPSAAVPAFRAIQRERHPHLVTILDVIAEPGGAQLPGQVSLQSGDALVVAEHVQGPTLHQVLDQHGAFQPDKAVAYLLRIASAMGFLHGRGLTHGAISPRSVVVEPAGRIIAPVVTCFVAPPVGSYVPPERLKGADPARHHDVWAMCALLHTMLTADPAFFGDSREVLLDHMLAGSVKPLADFGVADALLQSAIARGLHPNLRQRSISLSQLVAQLDAWERGADAPPPALAVPFGGYQPGRAGSGVEPLPTCCAATPVCNEVELLDAEATQPERSRTEQGARHDFRPTAPADEVAASPSKQVVKALSPPPGPSVPQHRREGRRRRWPGLVAGLVLLTGTAGWLLLDRPGSRERARDEASLHAPAARTASAVASAKATPEVSIAQRRSDCIRSYYAAEAFPEALPLDFVCGDGDFREVARRLHAVARPELEADAGVDGGPQPEVADSGVLVVVGVSRHRPRPLGWYELLATAIVRKNCCYQASAVRLPRTRGQCLQLEAVVRNIAAASQQVADVTPATADFEDAISCLSSIGLERTYVYDGPPNDENRAAFQKFLQRVAENEARRSKNR